MARRGSAYAWGTALAGAALVAGCAVSTPETGTTTEAVGGDGDGCGGLLCIDPLKQLPFVACYRANTRTVADGTRKLHTDTLLNQLQQAEGVQYGGLQPTPPNACGAAAYDCGGTFYDSSGAAVTVPPFPVATAHTDADVDKWKAEVLAFYASVYTTSARTARLSDGKAMMCREWAYVYFMAHPDPSILSALDALESYGAEYLAHQDARWLTNIVAAGDAAGCPTPPALVGNTENAFLVPFEDGLRFDQGWNNCAAADPNGKRDCPHPFDAPTGPGNHVDAVFVNEVRLPCVEGVPGQQGDVFDGDPTGGCGMACYR